MKNHESNRAYFDDDSGNSCSTVCNVQVSVEELEALYMESNCYALASHLYWAVWALVQVIYYSNEE